MEFCDLAIAFCDKNINKDEREGMHAGLYFF